MAYILRYTALVDEWGGAIKKGDTFTLQQNSNGPDITGILKILKDRGVEVKRYSSIGSGGGLKEGETKKINSWLVERIK